MNHHLLMQRRHTAKAYDAKRRVPTEVIEELLFALRLAPSSVNLQPWHFLVAETTEAKERVAKAAIGAFSYNRAKIIDASHVVVFCARTDINSEHVERLLRREEEDGRFRDSGARDAQHATRMTFVDLHRADMRAWAEKQVYLALGTFLLSAASASIDATPMEGFRADVLDEEFALRSSSLASIAVVSLGYRSDRDFNSGLPKSRLPTEEIFTFV